MLTGLRIVTIDGRSVSFGTILFRHTFGYLFTVLTAGLGFLLSRGESTRGALSMIICRYGGDIRKKAYFKVSFSVELDTQESQLYTFIMPQLIVKNVGQPD